MSFSMEFLLSNRMNGKCNGRMGWMDRFGGIKSIENRKIDTAEGRGGEGEGSQVIPREGDQLATNPSIDRGHPTTDP